MPAYRHFLAAQGVEAAAVTTPAKLAEVPLITKTNYLQANQLSDLVWPTARKEPLMFCATSGSTGEPYYFPRTDELSQQYAVMLEGFLKSSSYGNSPSLVLIGFGMGVWIGGVITMRAFEIAAARAKLPLAILPAGYNKAEIFKALRQLSPQFEQTIITGYPPFIKELVDEAADEGIALDKLNIRLLFAAEAFSEMFRNYICDKAGVGNPILDTLNIYGTADVGAMAGETPLSILIRRLAIEDPLLYRDLFGQIEKTPTLAQYNPDFIEFEVVNEELILSADAALPLIRYAVGDHGGSFDYDHVKAVFRRYKVDLEAEIQKAGLQRVINRKRPFVYVYERINLSATLHGILVYPEFIKDSLLSPRLAPDFTERFTMATKYDIDHNQFLQINLELRKGTKPSAALEKRAHSAIKAALETKSSEFLEISHHRQTDKLLQIVLWPNGHPRYFGPGTKQRWVEKS